MRQKVTRDRILQFMAAFDDAKTPARVYLVGGVTVDPKSFRSNVETVLKNFKA